MVALETAPTTQKTATVEHAHAVRVQSPVAALAVLFVVAGHLREDARVIFGAVPKATISNDQKA